LTDKEIIQPVDEPLEWVNNIVIIEKPNKTLRICIDPSELNKHIVLEIYPVPTLAEITPKLNNKNICCVFDIKDAFYNIKLDKKASNYCTFSSPELYLLNYRNTKVANLNYTPAQLLQNRNIRTKLPITVENMKPIINNNAHKTMLQNQLKQKQNYNKNSLNKEIVFNKGDKVNYS